MKKIISTICCITLMLTLSATPVLAAEPIIESEVAVATIDSSNGTATPYATSKGLWYRENWIFQGTQTFSVKPDSGANLNVWLNNSNTTVLTVYKRGLISNKKIYQTTFGSGERDVCVATNCSGTYIVQLTSAVDGTVVSILAYQN